MLQDGEDGALVVPLELEHGAVAVKRDLRTWLALSVEYVDDPRRAARREEGTLRVPRKDNLAPAMILLLQREELLLRDEGRGVTRATARPSACARQWAEAQAGGRSSAHTMSG